MVNKSSRVAVYNAINGERAYQQMRLERDGSTSPTKTHTPEEYVLYMEHYIAEARRVASTVWGPDAHRQILDVVRKVTALGVACMEENGAVEREGF